MRDFYKKSCKYLLLTEGCWIWSCGGMFCDYRKRLYEIFEDMAYEFL